MTTQVIAVSNRHPTEPYYRLDTFLKSLRRFNVDPVILGMNEPWEGLMTKPNHFRKWLRGDNWKPKERLIITDCWDVIFADHPDTVSERCRQRFGNAIVFNTEKACWPLAELAIHFPDTGTPWRFLNGGVMCGPADMLLAMFESMGLENFGFDRTLPDGSRVEPNDAVPLVRSYVEQPVSIVVDGQCEVFQTFSDCSVSDFEITSTGVRNKLTNTVPGVLHFNGASKNDIMPAVTRAMGL